MQCSSCSSIEIADIRRGREVVMDFVKVNVKEKETWCETIKY